MTPEFSQFTIRISPELLQKLNYIAKCHSRSSNKEIEQLIKKHLADFEREHGLIKIND